MIIESKRELWMRESTEFTLSNGKTVDGYRIVFVRFLNENEGLSDIDEHSEYTDVIDGSTVPNLVDNEYNDLESDDDFDIEDDDVNGDPEFYIGDENGKPIEE
jgi:hypothetical protein